MVGLLVSLFVWFGVVVLGLMLAVFDGFIRLFGFSCVLPCEFFGSALWLYISLIC